MAIKQQRVKKITTKARQLMRLLVSGETITAAAKKVGYSLSHASSLSNSDIFVREMELMQKDIRDKTVEMVAERDVIEMARERLRKEVDPSIERIVALRDAAEKEDVQLRAAMDILDRAGLKHTEKVDVDMNIEVDISIKKIIATALVDLREGRLSHADLEN